MTITDTDGRQHELADAYLPAAVRRLRSEGRGNRIIDTGVVQEHGPSGVLHLHRHVSVSDEEAERIITEARSVDLPVCFVRFDGYLSIAVLDKGGPRSVLSISGAGHLARSAEIDWLIEQLEHFQRTGQLLAGGDR